MKKYARPLIHALYTVAAGLVLFVGTDAGRSFIANHPGVAAALPVLVALFRVAEQLKRGNA